MRLAPGALVAIAVIFAAGPTLSAPPTLKIAPPEGGVFSPQTRPFAVGDVYRFTSTTRSVTTGGDLAGEQTNREVFDLEIIALTASGQPTLRYILREISVVDPRQPGISQMMAGFVGVPIEFETASGLHPSKTLNGQIVRRSYFANLERLSPGKAGMVKAMEKVFDTFEGRPSGIADFMTGDVDTIAGMYLKKIPIKPYTLPQSSSTRADGAVVVRTGGTVLNDIDKARCEVSYGRNSAIVVEQEQVFIRIKTQARLANDGWPLLLIQEKRTERGKTLEVETTEISRQGPAPGCG